MNYLKTVFGQRTHKWSACIFKYVELGIFWQSSVNISYSHRHPGSEG